MASRWVSMVELEMLIGKEAAQVLCRHAGGVSHRCPVHPHTDTLFARLIGAPALKKLCQAYGGEMIVLPNGQHTTKKMDIVARLEQGKSCRQIAMELGLTERWVEIVAKDLRPRAVQARLPF